MDERRFANYCKELGGKSSIKPESLGPTSDSTAQHSLRIYHQIQSWRGVELDAEEWGFEFKQGKLLPIQMTKPPAPDELLKIIRCSYKVDCTCIVYGLQCTTVYTGCRGVSCQHSVQISTESIL